MRITYKATFRKCYCFAHLTTFYIFILIGLLIIISWVANDSKHLDDTKSSLNTGYSEGFVNMFRMQLDQLSFNM